jgi:hypothetical protein
MCRRLLFAKFTYLARTPIVVYTVFIPTVVHLTVNKHLSLYDVSLACSGISMAILREGPKKEIQ